jgi:hypothetical protein
MAWVTGCLGCSLRGCWWPRGSQVALGITDGLIGLQMASRVAHWPGGVTGGHEGSRMASGGRS